MSPFKPSVSPLYLPIWISPTLGSSSKTAASQMSQPAASPGRRCERSEYSNPKITVLSRNGKGRKPLFPGVFAEDIEITKNDPLELEIRSFVERVKDRKQPVVSGLDGKKALEVALRIIDQIQRKIEKRKELGGFMG